MTVVTVRFQVQAQGRCDIIDLTETVQKELSRASLSAGTVTVFVAHTTASLTVIEAEGGLLEDFKRIWDHIAPEDPSYQHNVRNNDDNAHSHLRASMLGPSLAVPFVDKKLLLGTWQRIVLIDFDTRPRRRDLVLQFLGE